ncbi:MAG: ATP-binding protein, partial [Rubrivivax sp.]
MPSTDPPSFNLAADDPLARWRRAAESASDGLWEVALATGQAWYSDRLGHLLGLLPGALDAQLALAERVHPDDAGAWREAFERMAADVTPVDRLLRLRHADGRWRFMVLRGHGWRDATGAITRVTGALTDIDGLHRGRQVLEQEVVERTASLVAALADAERGRVEAQHANQAQARFVGHMSHELRTPLAGLLGLVDLARRVATDSGQQRYLEVAMQSGHALQRTIDDVLDLTRARDATRPLAHEPFDLAEAVAEVLRAAMPLVRGKGLVVRYDWVGDANWVRGDELRVRQTVANLVGNAAKFTASGHVAVVNELLPLPGHPDRLQLTLRVEDSGPGLTPERADEVFEDLVQGDTSLSRAHGGTGLGLTIARELARRMGGDITLRSTPGEGSVFTLGLSFDAATDPDPLPLPPPAHAWLLDHRADLGQWLQRRIERMGWSADLLPSVEAATQRARDAAPGTPRPALVVVAEHVMTPPPDLDALRQVLPGAHLSLLIGPDWNQPALEQ